MRKLLLSILLLTLNFSASAESISLEYEGFYARLKQLNSDNYSLVDIAFSVPKENGCIIESGVITTEKEQFPLVITEHQRIFIPFDESLKSNRAVIRLQMKEEAQQCGIAMQLRAKQVRSQYTQADLVALEQEMNGLLKKLQGFPMRYFMADIKGIRFQFEQATSVQIDGKQQMVDKRLSLSSQQVENLNKVEFSQQPIVVSPWIE